MAIAPRNSRRSSIDIWPGFVDALSQLLMVIIFILLVFTAGQFYLGTALSGRDQALQKLQHQVDELANLLALERQSNEELRSGTAALSSQLQSAVAERDQLKADLASMKKKLVAAESAMEAAASLRAKVVRLEAQLKGKK